MKLYITDIHEVSFYINQIFNNNNKKLEDTGIEVNNQVTFLMARLKQVFAMVIHKLSYRDNNNNFHFISVEDVLIKHLIKLSIKLQKQMGKYQKS